MRAPSAPEPAVHVAQMARDVTDAVRKQRTARRRLSLEKTTFEGRPAYKLKLVKKNGDEDIEYYDVETGLRAGVVATRESPMVPMQGTTIASDYKKFGQLLQPTTMKINVMTTQMIMSVTTVEYGNVDAAVFAPPAPIKALIK